MEPMMQVSTVTPPFLRVPTPVMTEGLPEQDLQQMQGGLTVPKLDGSTKD